MTGEITLVVRRRTEAAEGVVLLDLARSEGGLLRPWAPGAHIDVVLPDAAAGLAEAGGATGYASLIELLDAFNRTIYATAYDDSVATWVAAVGSNGTSAGTVRSWSTAVLAMTVLGTPGAAGAAAAVRIDSRGQPALSDALPPLSLAAQALSPTAAGEVVSFSCSAPPPPAVPAKPRLAVAPLGVAVAVAAPGAATPDAQPSPAFLITAQFQGQRAAAAGSGDGQPWGDAPTALSLTGDVAFQCAVASSGGASGHYAAAATHTLHALFVAAPWPFVADATVTYADGTRGVALAVRGATASDTVLAPPTFEIMTVGGDTAVLRPDGPQWTAPGPALSAASTVAVGAAPPMTGAAVIGVDGAVVALSFTTPPYEVACGVTADVLAAQRRDCPLLALAVANPLPAPYTAGSASTAATGSAAALAVTAACPPFCADGASASAWGGFGPVGWAPVALISGADDTMAVLAPAAIVPEQVGGRAAAVGTAASLLPVGGVRYVVPCVNYTSPLTGACSNASDPRSANCAWGAGFACTQCPTGGLCPGGSAAAPPAGTLIGTPFPGVELRILDEDGNPVPG